MLRKNRRISKISNLSWEADEFVYSKKGPLWYFSIIFLGIIIGLVFVFLKSYLASAVVFLATLVFLLEGNRKPHSLSIKLTNDGVFISEKFWPFSAFRSFFISSDRLFLTRLKKWQVPFSLPLGKIDRQKIRAYISERLPNSPHPILEFNSILQRLFKF